MVALNMGPFLYIASTYISTPESYHALKDQIVKSWKCRIHQVI